MPLRVKDIEVKVKDDYTIASEIFAPQGQLARRAWNRTQQVAAQARRNAPRKTGALASSIVPRKSSIWRPDRPVYEVHAGVSYAAPQEKGFVHWRSNRFVPGKHYLERANRQVGW